MAISAGDMLKETAGKLYLPIAQKSAATKTGDEVQLEFAVLEDGRALRTVVARLTLNEATELMGQMQHALGQR